MKLIHYLQKPISSFLLASISVIVIQTFVGFYWEDTMALHPAVAYGYISSPPYSIWFNESLFLQGPILAYLSTAFSQLPIMGIWFLILLVFVFAVWYHVGFRVICRIYSHNSVFGLVGAGLFILSMVGLSVNYIHFSRISILLTTGCLLAYFDYYLVENKRPWQTTLLFSVGLTLRLHTGILVLIAMSFLLLITTLRANTTYQLLRFHWIISLVCLFIMLHHKYNSANPALEAEQTYEYALSRGAILPLDSMKSEADSIKYIALTDYFLISDSVNIDIPFFKKITDSKSFMSVGISSDDMTQLSKTLLTILSEHKFAFIALYFFLLIALASAARHLIFSLAFFHVLGWLIVIIFAMKIDMFERFLLPWFVMLIGCSTWVVLHRLKNAHYWQNAGWIVIAIVFTLYVGKIYKLSHDREEEYNLNATSYLNNIETISLLKTPVIWDYNFLSFPSRLLIRKDLSVFQNTIYLSNFFILYYDFGQKRCFQKTGCSPLDWQCLNRIFNEDKDKYCFVMEEHMATFLKDYYRVLYGLDFNLIKEYPPHEVTPGNFVFHLNRDSTTTGV